MSFSEENGNVSNYLSVYGSDGSWGNENVQPLSDAGIKGKICEILAKCHPDLKSSFRHMTIYIVGSMLYRDTGILYPTDRVKEYMESIRPDLNFNELPYDPSEETSEGHAPVLNFIASIDDKQAENENRRKAQSSTKKRAN